MDKGKYLKMVKTIVFIVCFTLFQIVLLYSFKNLNDSIWPHIAKILLGLIFWLVLWQLSSSSYENHQGVSRWVQPSGLLKAFLILIISMGLGSWAIWNYVQIVGRPYFEMAHISSAIEFFYLENKAYPGSPGPITPYIYDELKGSANSKINTEHIDYLAQAKVGTIQDRWDHPYYFRIDPPDPRNPDFPNVVIISCGPNGIFENGKSDDLSFPPASTH